MQRWTVLLLTALTAAAVGLIFWQRPGPPPNARPAASADPSARPSASAAQDAGAPVDAGASDAEAPAANPDEPGSPGPGEPGGSTTSDAGATLLSGEAPPVLPTDAPKSAVFGVILVQYKGAQGAPASARSREAALE